MMHPLLRRQVNGVVAMLGNLPEDHDDANIEAEHAIVGGAIQTLKSVSQVIWGDIPQAKSRQHTANVIRMNEPAKAEGILTDTPQSTPDLESSEDTAQSDEVT